MKRVHVQSLARNKRPEALAEDVVNLKQELNRAKDEAKLALTEKRRLEAELVKLKQSLLKVGKSYLYNQYQSHFHFTL